MTRPNGGFTENLLTVASKSFVAGCFGCVGTAVALVVGFVLVFGVFPAQFVAVIRTLPIPIVPLTTPVSPTTVSTLPAIQVFVSTDNPPSGTEVTQIRVPVQQTLFICVRAPKGVDTHFAVRITLPNNQVVPFGGDFTTDSSGQENCLGAWTDFPNTPGIYRIDVVVGATIVGSTVVTAIS